MPYRSYGGSDPAEQYAGTPFDAFTGRLNGGALVMQVINQLAALKKQKQQEGWEVEDRDINKRYKEAQMSNLGETPQYRPTELEQKIEILSKNPDLFDKLFPRTQAKTTAQIEEESAARARGTASVTGTKIDDDARKDAVDARKSALVEAKARKKRYDDLMVERDSVDKQITSTKLKMALARGKQDDYSLAALGQSLNELELKKNMVDDYLNRMAGDTEAKATGSKLVNGVTYYRWSDGKWYPSKEDLQTKK
jgi:hypothetical protein